ncbi:carbohydrate ABC transporter permease [Cohnella fermenti]|uniref:Carbohydrate ABC transporter permease n=1 Tax=Cohnella fermenti TaxID=2565925 RepID=A0A4S4C9Q4_9BACL|nr:carbohydrate ABC transporter permease [Cohnella fermenti]THF84477.1 carbohydrate ABC transporter permease [Cohnella fermenti]
MQAIRIKPSRPDRIFELANMFFLCLLLLVVLYPLVYVTSASVSDPQDVNSGSMWLYPMHVTIEGYHRVFQNPDILTGYRNTILYTILGVLINLAVMVPCAYTLSRKDLPYRNAMMMFMLVTMFFSGGLIPSYLLVKNLHLLDTFWALVIPNAANVWSIIVIRTFFQSTIPREVEEAAEMDGCSVFRLFGRIVLPLSAPILAVMALFQGVGHWNAYFNAMIYLSNRDLFPLQLVIREILVLQEMSVSMLMNGSGDMEVMAEQARIADIVKYAVKIVSALPLLIVYPFLQRFFVKGMLIGSVKG